MIIRYVASLVCCICNKLAQLLAASRLSRASRAVEARSPARRAASAAALRGAVAGILWRVYPKPGFLMRLWLGGRDGRDIP